MLGLGRVKESFVVVIERDLFLFREFLTTTMSAMNTLEPPW